MAELPELPELDRLAATLRVDPARLDGLEACSPDELARLEGIVAAAMRREDEAFDAGLEDALKMVPLVLRPAARKIVFGGNHG
jgi:hypothetical protein